MKNENKLEQIFWKDGKFLDDKGKEIKPEPIGVSQMIEVVTSRFIGGTMISPNYEKELNNSLSTLLESLQKGDKRYVEINAFSKGKDVGIRDTEGSVIPFWHIAETIFMYRIYTSYL